MKNLLLKTLTLCVFASGITLFVLYQSGYFARNGYAYQGSHNGGVLPVKNTDTVASIKRDSMLLMFSSKTAVPTQRFAFQDSVEANRRMLLGSSKVAIPIKFDFSSNDSLTEVFRATKDSLIKPKKEKE